MRAGVCHLIFSMSVAKLKLDSKLLLELFKTMLENFKHPNQEIQDEAARAFEFFCETYFSKSADQDQISEQDDECSKLLLNEVRKMLPISINDMNIAVTRGYNMAFGKLSKSLLENLHEDVITTLIKNAIPKKIEADDAETRKQAVNSLVSVVEKLGIKSISAE